jgi:hypothetical protein
MQRFRIAAPIVLAILLPLAACSSVDVSAPEPAVGGAGGAATTTSHQGGASSDAGVPPAATRFVLRFISDIPESIWVDETDSSYAGHWLSILRGDGGAINKTKACEYCACDDCPNCPICGAPCPTATEIDSGGEVEWLWDGVEYAMEACPSSPQESCLAREISPAGSYVARFCWGLSYTGTLPCPAEVGDIVCADVPFQHPDPDGVVEHLVDHGG